MWTKEFRFCLFCLIYEDFLGYTEEVQEVCLEDVVDSVFAEYRLFKRENVNLEALESKYTFYIESKPKSIAKLKEVLPDWNKTFEIIKSILITFLIEKNSLKVFEKDKLVVSYIKFAEDYCVSTNVKLIHAVMSKLVDER